MEGRSEIDAVSRYIASPLGFAKIRKQRRNASAAIADVIANWLDQNINGEAWQEETRINVDLPPAHH